MAAPMPIFDKLYFWLPECAERSELKKLIQRYSGKLKVQHKVGKKDVIHIAPPNFPKEELSDKVNPREVLSSEWLEKCIEAGGLVDKEPYLLFNEEHYSALEQPVEPVGGGMVPPPPPPREDDDDDDDLDEDGRNSKKGAKKGEKLLPWSGEEFRVLIDYARKNRDSFGVSGNKLWERAEKENLLPGRTMQAMRECAKRKRAFIEMEDQPGGGRKSLRLDNGGLDGAVSRLADASGQDHAAVCWALFQCNGQFKRAKKILYGEITLNDFHPWSNDEDDVIIKYARGLLEAEVAPDSRHQHVVTAHNVIDPAESQAIDVLLTSRDYHEIAARARYLVDERQL